ncbi:hypothetical protein FOA52_006854 [Chlamydomonas sp. UWO 241]|nr:hypothetical protein FOA52_006854 [Chlamydomonas sp. UWO 241]
MRFGVNDLLEVKFPEGPLRNAASRLVKSKARVGSYADPYAAEAEAGDPEAAYGQPPVFVHELSLIAGSRDGGGGDEGGRSTVFMTQGGGAGDASEFTNLGMHFVDRPPPPARMSVSGTGQQQQQQQQQQDDEGGDGGGGGHGGSPDAARSGPRFQPLVEPAVPERGKGDNPVYGWHNKFVEARQAGRDALQQALYERSAGRFKARSFSKMGTKLAGLLMADLDSTQGRKSLVMRAGVVPENPYVKMEQAWEAQEDARRVRTQRANALDPNELRVMQRFYDQLCALVEAQRMSDPLCLMVVHRVRAALEGGASLNKSLLQAVIDHIAGFTKGCGLVRHNKYVLSVLTFVAKCAGVNSTLELEDLVAAAGIAVVVYGRAETPAKAAAAAAESAARAHVFSSSRQRSARRLSSSLMRSTSVRHTKGDSDSEGGGGGVSRQLSGAVAGLAATGRRESGTVVTPSTAATESVMLNDELRRQPSARFEGLLPEGSDE